MATISQTTQKWLETVAFFSPPTPRADDPELANSMEQLYDFHPAIINTVILTIFTS
jgi:hypothetical protein